MLPHACKILSFSSLILFKTSVRLAMQKCGEYDPFGVGVESVSCEDRVYSKIHISMAILNGMEHLSRLEEMKMDTGVMEFTFKPRPTEVKPLQDKFYFADLNTHILKESDEDLVIFLSNGEFAKVVTQRRAGQESVFVDCVPSPRIQPPERPSPIKWSSKRRRPMLGYSKRLRPTVGSMKRPRPTVGSIKRPRLVMGFPD